MNYTNIYAKLQQKSKTFYKVNLEPRGYQFIKKQILKISWHIVPTTIRKEKCFKKFLNWTPSARLPRCSYGVNFELEYLCENLPKFIVCPVCLLCGTMAEVDWQKPEFEKLGTMSLLKFKLVGRYRTVPDCYIDENFSVLSRSITTLCWLLR